MSVSKSLEHTAMHCEKNFNLIQVDASHLEDAAQESSLAEFHKAWHAVCTYLCLEGSAFVALRE
jgi:CTP synthase